MEIANFYTLQTKYKMAVHIGRTHYKTISPTASLPAMH